MEKMTFKSSDAIYGEENELSTVSAIEASSSKSCEKSQLRILQMLTQPST